MKKTVIILSAMFLMACHKSDTFPAIVHPSNPPPISASKISGTYKCTLTGTLNLWCTTTSSCYNGTRTLNESFTCTIKTNTDGTIVADSILHNEVQLYMKTTTTFQCNYFIYDPKGCAVGLPPQMSTGTLNADTITIVNSGYFSDSFHTIQSNFTCKMIKQ